MLYKANHIGALKIQYPGRRIMKLEIKPTLSAIVTAILFAGTAQAGNSTAQKQSIEQKVDNVFKDWQADEPGCSLDVTHQGKPIFSKGYGLANMEYGIANSQDSVFRIASTSKQFTAAAVALLAEQGKLSLDDSLRKHFPEFPIYADKITVRHLVHHTSGIRDYLVLSFLANWGEDFSDEDVLELLFAQQEANFEPGSEFLYSNSGYLLLAHLVKRVSGKSLRQYSDEHIFKPLGMNNTHFHDNHKQIVRNRASGYAKDRETGEFSIDMTILDMVGDGGIFTTTQDMRKWHANFKNNQLGSKTPELIELLVTPALLNNGENTDYAFGLDVGQTAGFNTIGHSGAFVGFRAHSLIVPEYDFGFTLFCNRADADPRGKVPQLLNVFLSDKVQTAKAGGKGKPDLKPAAPVELSEAALKQYSGAFWDADASSSGDVKFESGKLYLVPSARRKYEMQAIGDDRFSLKGLPPGFIVSFTSDKNNLKLSYPDGKETYHERFERPKVSKGELQRLQGEYYSPELDVSWQVKLQNDELVIIATDDSPMPLKAEKPGLFSFMAGSAHFGQSENGEAMFLLHSGRVKNLKFVKSKI